MIFSKLPRAIRLVGLHVSKHAPEILTGTGLVLGGGCVYTSCRATLKADRFLQEQSEKKEEIELKLNGEIDSDYTEEDAKKDKKAIRKETIKELAKDYALPVGLGAGSVACVLSGHHILAKRFGAVATALTATTGAFAEYRNRVAEMYGEEADYKIRMGSPEERTTITNPDGTTTEIVTPGKKSLYSCYSFMFDDKNPNWNPDFVANLNFLTLVQTHMSEKLKADGFLFLFDVKEYMHMSRKDMKPEDFEVGWIYDPSNPSIDNFVDLGLTDYQGNMVSNGEFGVRQLLMGGIRLDPNVDGYIMDKLPKLFGERKSIDSL